MPLELKVLDMIYSKLSIYLFACFDVLYIHHNIALEFKIVPNLKLYGKISLAVK